VIEKIFDFDAFLIPVWNKTDGMEESNTSIRVYLTL
jgi:hypothetical protein